MSHRRSRPLVCSCSGGSSAAQLADAVASRLDRDDAAEASCSAGVGGDVPSWVRTAKPGRPIVALDGRTLACVKDSPARHGLRADMYFRLSDDGVKNRRRADFDPAEAGGVFAAVRDRVRARPAFANNRRHKVPSEHRHLR